VAEESDLERTEPASARRLEQAREDGNVPQSRELMAFMVLAAGGGTFWIFGGWIAQHAADLIRHGLSFSRDAAFDTRVMREGAFDLSVEAFVLAAPIFIAIIVAIAATPLVMGGWILSPKAMQLDLTRMDPVKGVGRMFSWQSIAELVKAILKALLIGLVLFWVVRYEQDSLFALISQPIEVGLASFSRLLFLSFVGLIAGLALIAAVDVPFQLYQYHDRLKMTREELRQESKESEGDPHLKARIRSQQREMARGRMMAGKCRKADVVVTNPTHFAVALKYDGEGHGRRRSWWPKGSQPDRRADPGTGAATHAVFRCVEAPPLARALHRHAEVGDVDPGHRLFTAVAEVHGLRCIS
jgi:flagellar biosynthetic protein FlhB